ncbi:MAG: vanadium-dependent haloperoxidase, partial [Saprospiraceae bacterium]
KSVFYLQANEVYIIGNNLTPEQRIIAKYWSDDPGLTATPPGHSMSVTGIVLKNESANLALAAEVYSKVGLAVHDAFVSCWKGKYIFNLLRPVTYIKKYIDPNYSTLLNTPPFPEHTSGHSMQTAASMAVLEEYFGYHYKITDNTHESRTDINGSPRTFSSFALLASETAISRLYGGIHFRPSIELGILEGGIIGRNIASIKLKK